MPVRSAASTLESPAMRGLLKKLTLRTIPSGGGQFDHPPGNGALGDDERVYLPVS